MSEAKHTPGPMRVLSSVELAANASRRWREQYKDWADDDTFADGTTKGEINDALNRTAHTPEAISKIINEGWARPQCGSCREYSDFVVQMINPWSDEGRTDFDLCRKCIQHALNIAKATEAA